MAVGIWVLGDTPVLMIESLDYVQQRPYHFQKLVLVWSAMRHFATTLQQEGWPITYAIATDFQSALQDWLAQNNIHELWVMTPNDRPFVTYIQTLELVDCQLKLLDNNHFLWSRTEFQEWATKRKRLVLEDFYRAGRKKFNILMDGKQPVGGQWNFDKDNRKPPRKNSCPPIF